MRQNQPFFLKKPFHWLFLGHWPKYTKEAQRGCWYYWNDCDICGRATVVGITELYRPPG